MSDIVFLLVMIWNFWIEPAMEQKIVIAIDYTPQSQNAVKCNRFFVVNRLYRANAYYLPINFALKIIWKNYTDQETNWLLFIALNCQSFLLTKPVSGIRLRFNLNSLISYCWLRRQPCVTWSFGKYVERRRDQTEGTGRKNGFYVEG